MCNHPRYRTPQYMSAPEAYKQMRLSKICWMGKIVQNCKDCGADISKYKRVPTMTYQEYRKVRM